MALKFFPRESTSLFSFLREYNLSLSFCTHPSLTRALGIAYFTPSHYIFAQQASLFGDLYDVITPEVWSENVIFYHLYAVTMLDAYVKYHQSTGIWREHILYKNATGRFLDDPLATLHQLPDSSSAASWNRVGSSGSRALKRQTVNSGAALGVSIR